MSNSSTIVRSNADELARRERFRDLFLSSPIPAPEIQSNLGLFINRQTFSRFLFLHDLYQRIVPVHGIVAEFGVRWGQNLALLTMLRGIYEPFNYNRRIVGFDTFSGFPAVSREDGTNPKVTAGAYGVADGYENFLDQVLTYHESEAPISHLNKYALVKGDVTKTIPDYIAQHPETIFAMAYFDFDLFAPTKLALEYVLPRMPRGGLLVFDELNDKDFPGETLALQEVLGVSKLRLQRLPFSGNASFAIVE